MATKLLATAVWVGIASSSMALVQPTPAAAQDPSAYAPVTQAQTAQVQAPGNECGSLCRMVRVLSGQATATPQVEQPVEQQQPRRHFRPRRTTAKTTRQNGGASQTGAVASQAGKLRAVTSADGAHAAILADLNAILPTEMPVETVSSQGPILKDLLTLPDVDLTIVSSLSLSRGSDMSDRLVYLTKLFTEELHAVSTSDVDRLEDLEGKPVFLGPPGSDAEAAAEALLAARGIKVAPAPGTFSEALQGLREKRVAAVFVLAPKPFAPLAELSAADGVRLLPLGHRASDEVFYPSTFAAADYPNLIPAGDVVETVAMDAVLVAPRWRESSPRQKELSAFTRRVFEELPALLEPGRHPKWKETNLAAAIESPRRLRSAQEWITAKLKEQHQARATPSDKRQRVGEAQ
jgi:hypothetical protein